MTPLLVVQSLSVAFAGDVQAVKDVALDIGAGETVGLVGESGSGKTTLGLALTRLLPPSAAIRGAVRLDGAEVLGLSEPALCRVRGGRIAYVFQEPSTSLNPVMTIGAQLIETLERHAALRGAAAQHAAAEWLSRVGIPAARERLHSYPHELSGGMKQRVMIAMACAAGPALLIADEPTTALDVTLERQIVRLLRRLQQELGLSILLISHNIHLVSQLAQRMAVMWRGQIVETGPTEEVLRGGRHAYTQQLLAAQPVVPWMTS